MSQEFPYSLVRDFAVQAARSPDSVALRDGEFLLSCRDLDAASSRLAAEFGHSRIPRGSTLGLRLDHGWLIVVGALGARKYGCGYLALNPRSPTAEQRALLADRGIRHVLVCGENGLAVEHVRYRT
ncbi:non-ribosomal peptide synthetase component F [Kitasatospora sp. GP30]|uniref:AMP-binding protein n=1 Tax=Kitasatospora sp. GP30 TaxID=3035084 RepID=UPI000C708437|nr:AMP-binding protein [Kitasatospora sp. GP30]MDH6142155.1 non-ribosomal peptide synthetase component F [Kitasatospora sp. GP30]